ncbi:ARM repeat-containing protein [Basidiobolus meristosporus CBS 931.73]|uniref:Importin-13 n=1 Tax=Basidiobolus meristosporus CBS 931.73 TaxID=1314790 RepID=A0A1Y1XZ50_9FUNG|nr:ARM repeat-containing protein [Basidiobolus meristosporus CBS 931.73]|eukprot:ORX90935.1 ARM repeat-containing protein [Basidiobolus meristosporus CBS 931.73]
MNFGNPPYFPEQSMPQKTVESSSFYPDLASFLSELEVPTPAAVNALHSLQKEPSGWQLASALLETNSSQNQFFGAHTYQIKISRDWDTLPEDQVHRLREELLKWIVEFSNGPNLVLTKLCQALTTYALRTVPDQWTNFIPATLQALESESKNPHGRPVNNENAFLEILTLIPEELNRADLVGSKKSQFNQELLNSIPLVLNTVGAFLSDDTRTDPAYDFLRQKSLRCLQSWIQYGIPPDSLAPIFNRALDLLRRESTFEASIEVLIELLTRQGSSQYGNTLSESFFRCIASPWMKSTTEASISESNDDVAAYLARLLTTYGEEFTEYIVQHLSNPDVGVYLEMMIGFIGFPGYFAADQEISEIPLNFWYLLQESILDLTIECEDQAIIQRTKTIASMVFSKLVQVLRQKIEYPSEEEWSSWSKDVRERFKIYRRDVGDTLINSYLVLHGEMLEYLLDLAATQLSSDRAVSHWQDLESTLFCLRSISEAVSSEDPHIARLFGDEILGRLPVQGHNKIRLTTLQILGSYADWLKRHPQHLLPSLNFIIPTLSDPELAFIAASSFKDICDTCRAELVDGVESLVTMYTHISSSIEEREKQKVLESISAVIQALPPRKTLEPLSVLIGDILQTITKAFDVGKQTGNFLECRPVVLSHILYLVACCRGIQPPDDEPTNAAEPDETNAVLNLPEAQRVSVAIWGLVEEISKAYCQDEEIMEAICSLLNTSIMSSSHVFTMGFSNMASFLHQTYQRYQHPYILDTVCQLVTVYGSEEQNVMILSELLATLTGITLGNIRNLQGMEENPHLTSSYFGMLSRYVRKCPVALFTTPPDVFNNIILFAVSGLGLQERLALRSGIGFMVDLIGLNTGNQAILDSIDHVVNTFGQQIMQELLMGIGGRLPRSFVTLLTDLLYKLTGKYIQNCRQWLAILLAQENFPSSHIDKPSKEAFAKSIMTTRGVKRFKEIVTEFSLRCRRMENSAYGST